MCALVFTIQTKQKPVSRKTCSNEWSKTPLHRVPLKALLWNTGFNYLVISTEQGIKAKWSKARVRFERKGGRKWWKRGNSCESQKERKNRRQKSWQRLKRKEKLRNKRRKIWKSQIKGWRSGRKKRGNGENEGKEGLQSIVVQKRKENREKFEVKKKEKKKESDGKRN